MMEIPFGQPGRIFRSPIPFGKYDPGGVIYEAYHDNDFSEIVHLSEDYECKEKARRDLRALYTQDGFTVVHLPIVDFGIPNAQVLRVALDATVHQAQSGLHIAIHCSAGIGRTGLFTAVLAKKLLHLPGEEAIEWVRRCIFGAVETPRTGASSEASSSSLWWQTSETLESGDVWPAAGFIDTELGVSMKLEVRHGATDVYASNLLAP